MSLVVVLPAAPVMPTIRAAVRSRTAPADRRERDVRVLGDERRGGATREGVRDEVLAVADGHEQVAFLDPARVDLQPGDLARPGPGDQPAERLDQVQLERDHRRAVIPASTLRATSRSSNGTLPVASSCSGSAPRPAITHYLARPGLLERLGDRRPPVELDLDAGRALLPRPRRRSARAAPTAGCRRSGSCGRRARETDTAHQRPLAPVAVAAGAEHDREPAVAEAARRADDVLERVGRVRVVDDHGERLAGVDRLEPARDARQRLDSALDRVAVDTERLGGEGGTDRVLAVEGSAERQLDPVERIRGRGVESDRVGDGPQRAASPTRRRR